MDRRKLSATTDTTLLKASTSNEQFAMQKIAQGTLEDASSTLLRLIADNIRTQRVTNRHILVACLLKLGLLDELLQLLSQTTVTGDENISRAVESIEKMIENRYYNTLDTINPKIRATTLEQIFSTLKEEYDKDLTMNLISSVIFTTTIFLIKLDPENEHSSSNPIIDLEILFNYLAKYLNELPFRASETLVRATNGLIVAIKNRLDTLADNETIRECFKALIETIAGQCLVESRYKSAAMLYSQIEDNVNAIKSLMRGGEVDTVISYALLVRDITVNRITINYLKHLKVDAKIIEDFITRSNV